MKDIKSEQIYRQSAVIPYTFEEDVLKILLITSMSKKNWIIPKGLIDDGLSAQESALKEAYEEAGIAGSIKGKRQGMYSYFKWGGLCQVDVYACRVTKIYDIWPEQFERKRAWYSSKNAIEKIENEDLKDIVRKFVGTKAK